jgi:uncharacterized protein (TIGR03067 family)
MDELESRALKLAKELTDFGAELRLACAYTQVDPASSLTKSRIVMEKLLLDIYGREMGHEPKKPLLGDMLADNQFTRKIERRILSRMNAIRDMGNLGPHGEAVEASDAARVLDDLCTILDWYLERTPLSGPAPPVGAQAAVAAPPPAPPAAAAAPRGWALKLSLAILTAAVVLLVLLLLFGPRLGLWQPAGKPDDSPGPSPRDSLDPRRVVGDLEGLQGKWETVEVEVDGEVGKPLYKTMVIKDHTLSYFYEDGRPGNTFTFDLAPDKRPRQIDMITSVSKVRIEGIYSLEDDILKICGIEDPLAARKVPRPDEFRTRPGSNLLLMRFKRK